MCCRNIFFCDVSQSLLISSYIHVCRSRSLRDDLKNIKSQNKYIEYRWSTLWLPSCISDILHHVKKIDDDENEKKVYRVCCELDEASRARGVFFKVFYMPRPAYRLQTNVPSDPGQIFTRLLSVTTVKKFADVSHMRYTTAILMLVLYKKHASKLIRPH